MVNDLVDDEQLMFRLFSRDLDPSITVAAELDVDSIDELPFVTFLASGGDQNANGPGLWSVSLTVNVYGDADSEAWDTCKSVYRVVHAWAQPRASVIPDLGYVSTVTDLNKFSRVVTVDMQGKNVSQYAATFLLSIRN